MGTMLGAGGTLTGRAFGLWTGCESRSTIGPMLPISEEDREQRAWSRSLAFGVVAAVVIIIGALSLITGEFALGAFLALFGLINLVVALHYADVFWRRWTAPVICGIAGIGCLAIWQLGWLSHDNTAPTLTAAKYSAIHTGQTVAQVEAIVGGSPDITTTGLDSAGRPVSECIDYSGTSSAPRAHKFCFDNNGRLSRKPPF
jgi:hypothetical protein